LRVCAEADWRLVAPEMVTAPGMNTEPLFWMVSKSGWGQRYSNHIYVNPCTLTPFSAWRHGGTLKGGPMTVAGTPHYPAHVTCPRRT
jgi:hypothetical protein